MLRTNRNNVLFTVYKWMIIFVALKLVNSDLQSPCPNVFEYQYDNNKQLFGLIRVPSIKDRNGVINLDVQLSVGNPVQGFNGNIELTSAKSSIVNDIRQNNPLHYRLQFPQWVNIPPAITKISVNGKLICSGYPIERKRASVVTTINLQHTITIGTPQGNRGSSFFNLINPESDFNSKPIQIPSFNFNKPQSDKPSKVFFSIPGTNQNNRFTRPNRFNNQNNFLNDDFYSRPQNNNFFGETLQIPFASNGENDWAIHQQPPFSLFDSNNNDINNMKENNGFFFTPVDYQPFGENSPGGVSHESRDQISPSSNKPSVNDYKPLINRMPTQMPIGEEEITTMDTSLVQRPLSNICGVSDISNALLVNGNHVGKGTHPWLSAIFMQSAEGLKFICGSTLISQKHVITAAHCVAKSRPEQLWIVLGRENIQSWSSKGSQTIQADSIQIHPDYRPKKADADAAIVVLKENAIFSDLIKPACLWTGDKDVKLIFKKKGTVVGWGKDGTGKLYSPEPRQFDFPVVSEEDCLRSNPAFVRITSSRTFCAGYRNDTGPCNGDSGSGFLMRVNRRWTLRGIVSMSLLRDDGGCDLEQYVVYTDIVQFSEWVLSFLQR